MKFYKGIFKFHLKQNILNCFLVYIHDGNNNNEQF